MAVHPVNTENALRLEQARKIAQARRKEIGKQAKAGDLTFSALLLIAKVDDAVGKVRVQHGVQMMPGWGKQLTKRVLADLAIAPNTTLRQLSSWTRVAPELTTRIDHGAALRPPLPDGWPLWGDAVWVTSWTETRQ